MPTLGSSFSPQYEPLTLAFYECQLWTWRLPLSLSSIQAPPGPLTKRFGYLNFIWPTMMPETGHLLFMLQRSSRKHVTVAGALWFNQSDSYKKLTCQACDNLCGKSRWAKNIFKLVSLSIFERFPRIPVRCWMPIEGLIFGRLGEEVFDTVYHGCGSQSSEGGTKTNRLAGA